MRNVLVELRNDADIMIRIEINYIKKLSPNKKENSNKTKQITPPPGEKKKKKPLKHLKTWSC